MNLVAYNIYKKDTNLNWSNGAPKYGIRNGVISWNHEECFQLDQENCYDFIYGLYNGTVSILRVDFFTMFSTLPSLYSKYALSSLFDPGLPLVRGCQLCRGVSVNLQTLPKTKCADCEWILSLYRSRMTYRQGDQCNIYITNEHHTEQHISQSLPLVEAVMSDGIYLMFYLNNIYSEKTFNYYKLLIQKYDRANCKLCGIKCNESVCSSCLDYSLRITAPNEIKKICIIRDYVGDDSYIVIVKFLAQLVYAEWKEEFFNYSYINSMSGGDASDDIMAGYVDYLNNL